MSFSPSFDFVDVDVRLKNSQLQQSIYDAAKDENVVAVYGLLLGAGCTDAIRVTVPVKRPDGTTRLHKDGVKPQVWLVPQAGNDWKTNVPCNWTQTVVRAAPNSVTKLFRPYFVFYERDTSGTTNSVVHKIADGCPWAGNILVMLQGLTRDTVDHVGLHEVDSIKDVVAALIRNRTIIQEELPLDPEPNTP